jgi:hypothetical protein
MIWVLRWPICMTCTALASRNFHITNWSPGKHRHDCSMTFSSVEQGDRSYVRQRANPISRFLMRKFWFGVTDGSMRFLVVLAWFISEKLLMFTVWVSILVGVAFRLCRIPLQLKSAYYKTTSISFMPFSLRLIMVVFTYHCTSSIIVL